MINSQAATPAFQGVATNPNDVKFRSSVIAKTISNDVLLQSLFDQIEVRTSNQTDSVEDVSPSSRLIASLFGLMEAHQRPQGQDARVAMSQIQCLVKLMTWSLRRSLLSTHHFLTKSIASRCLASLFFPSQTLTWEEMLKGCFKDCLENITLFEVNKQVDGSLAPYLDDAIDAQTSLHAALNRDFNICLSTTTKKLVELHKPEWSEVLEASSHAVLLWQVLYQWNKGENVISIPPHLNIQRIEWNQIADLNSKIASSLAAEAKAALSMTSKHVTISTSKGSVASGDEAKKFFMTEPSPINQPKSSMDSESMSTVASIERQLDQTDEFLSKLHLEVIEQDTAPAKRVLSEIRSSTDPQLSRLLEAAIDRSRCDKNSISLLVVRAVSTLNSESVRTAGSEPAEWQLQAYREIKSKTVGTVSLAYTTAAGELAIVIEDLDRTQVTRLARETILTREYTIATTGRTSVRCGVVCGSATVSCPARGFSFEQLSSAAERCLQGAQLQGRGAIKGLEVF